MSQQPIAINLALIVERVLRDPKGWQVDLLKEELVIADRTYRKYRKILTESFPPFSHSDGSLLTEVSEGDERFLRLRRMSDHADS